ncbi:uncharacterized protein IUM83_05545 [Phytophthora cinnamomi]|uniref:uncharacterized protein n=1 Tax=Phytophthora cinnamomi TaxID=4785 RepID=UPI00355A56D9|nr:hypothetical protein IUM83_05545 [Phytophthora cinnamomi]
MPPKKRLSAHSSSPRQSVALTKGDWLDVMDHDGVWNVARVLSVPSPEEVEVMYDGWPEDYDEVVRVDSDRVAPFHTFTWAVKCWVKYLNWPLWPSVITIRTPGTEEGIKNLAMENRLYVDFLDDPNFAKRDRCWQKKRQVKTFKDNYDANRTGTNGAQFERALEFVLRSDATTKMPKFAKGTLPVQYEYVTTGSVEGMRKNMGKGLWYRNFANNKQRHMQTHVYEVIGDDEEEEDISSGKPMPKLKVRRPKTSSRIDTTPTIQKKKRSLPAKKQQIPVQIEDEPLVQVESSYEFGVTRNSDNSGDSEHERRASLIKKRRKNRSTVPPSANVRGSRNERHMISSKDTNAAATMPRHVTVLMDEIIVDDDDDSGSSGVVNPRPTRKSPNKKPTKMTARRSIPPIRGDLSLAASAKTSTRTPNSDDDSEEGEEKEVPRHAVNDVELDRLSPKTVLDSLRTEHLGKEKSRSGDVTASRTSRQPKSAKRPKPKTALEQRIALTKELLQGLDKEKQLAAKSIPDQGRKKTTTLSSRGSRDGNRPVAHQAKMLESYQLENSDLSFIRPNSESYGSQGIDTSHEGVFTETSFAFGLESEELRHSFLSVEKDYSSDSQESKGIPTAPDEPVMIDPPSAPKESARRMKAESKTLEMKTSGDSEQRPEEKIISDDDGEDKSPSDPKESTRRKKAGLKVVEPKTPAEMKQRSKEKPISVDDGEEKSQEVRRRFCVMQAGLEGATEADVLFQAISGGEKIGGGMPLQIPDTILLSPSGQPSVWYTTSSAGRVKARDLMRVSPQAILEAFHTPLPHRRNPCAGTDDAVAVQRLGFEVITLVSQQLKVFCKDMELPTICLPMESDSNPARSRLTKGVFCLQRHIPCQNNASFLVVWRHSHVLPSNEKRDNYEKSTHPVSGSRGEESIHKSTGSKRSTPRAHSDVFLLTQIAVDIERGVNEIIDDGTTENERDQAQLQSVCRLEHLDIERPGNTTSKTLRQGGFDAGVMAPLLFYMKRVTSEVANSINLGHNTRQACGLACEFFVGEHNRSVYFQHCVAFNGSQEHRLGKFCGRLILCQDRCASFTSARYHPRSPRWKE